MDTLINAKKVAAATGISRTTIWRMEKLKAFPSHIQLSPRRVAWSQDEVNAWIEAKKDIRTDDS